MISKFIQLTVRCIHVLYMMINFYLWFCIHWEGLLSTDVYPESLYHAHLGTQISDALARSLSLCLTHSVLLRQKHILRNHNLHFIQDDRSLMLRNGYAIQTTELTELHHSRDIIILPLFCLGDQVLSRVYLWPTSVESIFETGRFCFPRNSPFQLQVSREIQSNLKHYFYWKQSFMHIFEIGHNIILLA